MSHKVHLLSTVLLDQSAVDKAAEAGITLDAVPYINTATIADKKLRSEIEALYAQPLTVVFTSANAVRALGERVTNKQPNWNIYCTGNATKNAALDIFDASKIHGTANDAAALAEVIRAAGIKEVVFFCGDKRMDTLPRSLQGAGIAVKEMIVYRTEQTPVKITKGYDGILFFSPSGVSSFFSVNKIAPHTVLFAIGNTTAAAIKEHTNNPVIISDSAFKKMLVAKAINYFHKQATATQEQNSNERIKE